MSTDVATGKAGVQIAEYARDHGADLIVVGSHSPGAKDYFLGSTAQRVSRRAPCSVLIVR
jgi:nucleotide-binding universal stress UspA family protein